SQRDHKKASLQSEAFFVPFRVESIGVRFIEGSRYSLGPAGLNQSQRDHKKASLQSEAFFVPFRVESIGVRFIEGSRYSLGTLRG
ncbi:hypothetical protein, partial [Sphingobacterium paucimobilis]|uniref:hypothetical protein n=1 Tax=Sphingobacterium paucimobilis TaxID=1385985 RepID=UPI001F2BBA41